MFDNAGMGFIEGMGNDILSGKFNAKDFGEMAGIENVKFKMLTTEFEVGGEKFELTMYDVGTSEQRFLLNGEEVPAECLFDMI